MALIPPHFLNSVVSIEVDIKNQQGQDVKKAIATGFLVGREVGKNEQGDGLYHIFIVTNRHVFQNPNSKEYLKQVYFRFNTLEKQGHYFSVDLLKADNTPLWAMHADPKIDLAVLQINPEAAQEAKIDYYFFPENDFFPAKEFEARNISTGDGLFVLGFPMGISGKARNFVIVRQGIIARVDEEILAEGFYYIDASAFPGNSGGPVICKPEVVSVGGTKNNNRAGLIGVISAGETYSDIAISQQTGDARIIFKEQTGLVRIVPVELIWEIIDAIPKATAEEAKIEDAGQGAIE